MKRTIKVSRPANGSGTTVTVTLLEDGVTVSYALKSAATSVAASIRAADKQAREMLAQARVEINEAA